jgi:hypothetical protein
MEAYMTTLEKDRLLQGSRISVDWELIEQPRLTEDQVRSIVGAPSVRESETCMCGRELNSCSDAYEHMSHGY